MILKYKDFLLEKNTNYITLYKESIDKLRDLNESLDNELNKDIFKYSNVYAKGGAARLALLLYVDKTYSDIIRDSDFVCIGDYHDLDEDVEYISTIQKYFNTRDITLNEVLLRPDSLIFTREAYRDAQKRIVNPKGNIFVKNDDLHITTRMMARCLLFAVRYSMDLINVNHEDDDDFNVFICLIKAYELNIHHKYFYKCKEYKLANADKCNTIGDWLIYFLNNIRIYINKDVLKAFTNDMIDNLNNISNIDRDSILNDYPAIKMEVDKINFDDIGDDIKKLGVKIRKPNRKI